MPLIIKRRKAPVKPLTEVERAFANSALLKEFGHCIINGKTYVSTEEAKRILGIECGYRLMHLTQAYGLPHILNPLGMHAYRTLYERDSVEGLSRLLLTEGMACA